MADRDMNWTLEVVIVPVSDVDRAKTFYTEKAGFDVDHDRSFSEDMRIVQLTPPGSACSIAIGSGLSEGEPGSWQGLQLVVSDIEAAHAELVGRGPRSARCRGSSGVRLSSSRTRTATGGRCSRCPFPVSRNGRQYKVVA